MDSVLGQRTGIRGSEIIENAYGRHSTVLTDGGTATTTTTTTETKPLISDEEWIKTNSDAAGYGSTTTTVNKNDTDNDTTDSRGDNDGKVIQQDDGSRSGSSSNFFAEIPAIIVTLMINFMTAIPFGVAYFPLGWSNNGGGGDGDDDATDDATAGGAEDGISGPFPLPGM
jgi:hypothetical protein